MERLPLRDLDTTGAKAGQPPVYDAVTDSYVPGDGSAGGGSFNPAAGRSPRLVPHGVKLRGANIVPRASGITVWSDLYAGWSTKWASIVKPQIDDAASVGANAIRLIGDVYGVHTGALTQDAYVAAYEQFVDYCANLGLYVYACGGGASSWGGATKEQALAILQAQAAMLDTKPNVIGIDVVQELGLTSSLWTNMGISEHDLVSFLFNGIRQVTTLPLTCSCLGSNNSSAAQWNDGTVAAFADLVDFYDYHPYYQMATSDLDPFFAANTAGKPLLLGEWGGTSQNLAVHRGAAAVQALPKVVGGFIWSIVDNASTVDWALFDWNWNERTSVSTIFRTVPDHQGTLPEAGHTVQDEGTILPARSKLNFVGAGVTAADDPTKDATTVTIPGAGLTVQDENATVATGVTQLDFQGASVRAAAGTGEVVVTVTSPGGEQLVADGMSPPVPLTNETEDDYLYEG